MKNIIVKYTLVINSTVAQKTFPIIIKKIIKNMF